MKRIKYILILFVSVIYAQKDTINVNLYTSTQLIFPTNVDKVKISTKNAFIIYEKDENVVILQSKATKDEYSNSNVFITTDDKMYYNFLLAYKENVKNSFFIEEHQSLNYNREKYLLNEKDTLKEIEPTKKVYKESINKKEIVSEESVVGRILKDKYVLKKAYVKKSDVIFQMCNNYYHNNKSYYKVFIENNSSLDYDLKFIKFRVETLDKKSKKSSITKEIVEDDYIIHGDNKGTISPGEKRYLVFEFDKLTNNKEEYFTIEFKEKNGNRDALITLPSYLVNDPHLLNKKSKKKKVKRKNKK